MTKRGRQGLRPQVRDLPRFPRDLLPPLRPCRRATLTQYVTSTFVPRNLDPGTSLQPRARRPRPPYVTSTPSHVTLTPVLHFDPSIAGSRKQYGGQGSSQPKRIRAGHQVRAPHGGEPRSARGPEESVAGGREVVRRTRDSGPPTSPDVGRDRALGCAVPPRAEWHHRARREGSGRTRSRLAGAAGYRRALLVTRDPRAQGSARRKRVGGTWKGVGAALKGPHAWGSSRGGVGPADTSHVHPPLSRLGTRSRRTGQRGGAPRRKTARSKASTSQRARRPSGQDKGPGPRTGA